MTPEDEEDTTMYDVVGKTGSTSEKGVYVAYARHIRVTMRDPRLPVRRRARR